MTEVSKEAVEALVKALSNVDETIELDLIDATAVAFELKKQGFTIARAETSLSPKQIKALEEAEVPKEHDHLNAELKPAMSEAELEREAVKLNSSVRVGRDLTDEIMALAKKYRGG